MILKELNSGHEVKCTCNSCNGTGIYKGYSERDDLGVICCSCNGKGYYTLELNENLQLVQDEKTGIVYRVNNGIIDGYVELFDKLHIRNDVNFVMYGTGRFFSPEYLFENGASEIEVIKYSDFIEGKLPLPMIKYTCPRQLSQIYGSKIFYNDCHIGCFNDCEKYGTKECWDKFYDKAQTIEERQNVLRKIR